ncbi:hypothetical protein CLV46_0830 [Diaminobutyricimonas aerilata]|uniref:Uncharacterized protein n=1 Tax=Diaminobutyricimonas aerilata TaxID=1162967 RepID=A0A2M9CHC7_9MICO|nr:hypothetical protein [Diaminobutyricimonas aerilata]PJJ71287.1 hypothetical protein CLV46_0830 [Diaminobutyricimonas aerilata]
MSLTTATKPAQLSTTATGILVTGEDYRFAIEYTNDVFARSPYAKLGDRDGLNWSDLNLISSAHTAGLPDEVLEYGRPVAEQFDDRVVITLDVRSTAWEQHRLTIVCTARTVAFTVTVTGSGRLTDLVLFGGSASTEHGATGVFRSRIDFASVLVPVPTEPVQVVRPARSSAVLGAIGDADPGRLNGIFSPPPLAFGLARELAEGPTDVPGGQWLGMWVREAVERLTFTAVRYEPIDGGFHLRFSYEGHTIVDGEWTSPTVVFRHADGGWAVLEDYRADLVDHGSAPEAAPEVADWWLEPIFCGWGAQCARAMHLLREVPDPTADTEAESPEEENLVVRAAPSFARQDVYDEFRLTLELNDLRPGTIVIDDRWQAEYGTATVDEEHWPDLKGWIADRHREGVKVLLWWKAWDPEGLPADECVTDAAGRPIAVDPANPAYLERLERIVAHLLSADGLDADGFKVDFTQRTPTGQTLRGHDGVWGIAALHRLLDVLYRSAKTTKPDALVICHTVHPSFGDVADMIRLNDVLERDIHGERVSVVSQLAFRHAVATRALPEHPIDTDQWPMPNREQWLDYVAAQGSLGVPALYYLESIDRSGERIHAEDLAAVAESWADYRKALRA